MKTLFKFMAVCLLTNSIANAQYFEPGKTNFFTLYDSLIKEYGERLNSDTSEGGEIATFNKWVNWWGERLYPTGDYTLFLKSMENYVNPNTAARMSSFPVTSNWTPLGPSDSPQGTGGKGTGMTFTVKFHPTYNNTLFCSGWGGLWISTDNGAYWQNFHTDKGLPQCAVIDVAVHPTNPDMIFVATGDGDGDGNLSYAPSIGIWRFIWGGSSDNWENISTGLPTFVNDPDKFYYMRTLAMHPTDPDIIFVATSVGIFQTVNATDPDPNWLELKDPDIAGKYFRTIVFKPENPNTIYASGKEVFKSTDGGATWNNLNLSVPTVAGESVSRINIALTPANPSLLYAYIFTNGGANSYYFQKYNGTVWENKTKVPVAVHIKNRGLLAMTVSPTNTNEIYVGNTVIFRSLNGGGSWEQISLYNGAIHADIHDLRLRSETRSGSTVNILYTANDGGMFRTKINPATAVKVNPNDPNLDNATWESINKGLAVGTIFRMGGDARNPGRMLIGEQDCGVNWYVTDASTSTTNPWYIRRTGDGAECAIDYTNSNILYYSTIGSRFIREEQINGQRIINYFGIGGDNKIKPFIIDLVDPNTFYFERHGLAKGKWDGTKVNWEVNNYFSYISQGCSTVISEPVRSISQAPSNNKYIYVSTHGFLHGFTDPCNPAPQLFVTKVGGVDYQPGGCTLNCWKEITPPSLPSCTTFSCVPQITGIAVSSADPEKIWICFSGFHSQYKVWAYDGTTDIWSNYSTGIDNFPVNTIVYQNGTCDGLYVGTDMGVYYRDATMSRWQSFADNLPNVVITELEIFYPSSKLRAATFGRGVWESDLAVTSQTISSVTQWDNTTIEIAGDLTINADLTISNSTLSLGSSNAPKITVNTGTTLILDNSTINYLCNNTYYHLEVNEGGTVIFRNQSAFNIENQSEITVHIGGKIMVESTAALNYNNLTAGKGIIFSSILSEVAEPFVEIRGTLTVADHANFTFTGNGFLRFGLPVATGGASNILTGPHSKITLKGSDRNDKIAEILDNTYILPNWDGTTGFTIKDGTVFMGADAYIRTANTRYVFTNASFLKLSTSKFRTISTGGCYAPIDNITVDGAIRGISANLSTCQGSPLYVTNSIFQNCETGIYTFSKGGIFNNVKLLNNTTGWKADAPVFKSTMNNCEVKNNQTGVEYNGGAGSSLYISASVINNNTVQAVKVTGVEAKIRCSEISSNGTGVYVCLNGTLNMGIDANLNSGSIPSLEHDGGWVSATVNEFTIRTSFAQGLYLLNGFNNLVPHFKGTQSIVNGTLTNQINLIRVDNNRWKSSSSLNTPSAQRMPVNNLDYKLGYYMKPIYSDKWYRSTILSDPAPVILPPPCGNVLKIDLPEMVGCPGCISLFTKDFTGEKLDNAVSFALKKMSEIHDGCDKFEACHGNNVLREDRKAIDLFNQILMYRIPHPKPEEEELLRMAYMKMLRAISNAFLTGMMTREENSPIFSPELQMVVEVQDKLIQEANNGDTDYFKRLFVSMEKAQVLRMAGRHDVSLPLLEQIDNWVRTEERNWVEQWECWVRNEKLYYEGSATPLEFSERIAGCSGANASGARLAGTESADINNNNKDKTVYETPVKIVKESVKNDLTNHFEFHLLPNPSQGFFKVLHNLGSDTKTLLEITDLRGKKVLALPAAQIQSNSTLNLTLLPKGVYLYHIRNQEGNGVNGKLVIMY